MNEKQDDMPLSKEREQVRSRKGRPRSKEAEAEALRRNLLRRKAAKLVGSGKASEDV